MHVTTLLRLSDKEPIRLTGTEDELEGVAKKLKKFGATGDDILFGMMCLPVLSIELYRRDYIRVILPVRHINKNIKANTITDTVIGKEPYANTKTVN